MRTFVWVLALVLLLVCVVAQGLPWSGAPQTAGRDPALIAKGVTVALVALTVAMVVARFVEALP